jgi:hypothetical protein
MNRKSAETWQSGSYFTLSRRDGRWTLIAPDGRPFFSLGLNHFDSAGLRHPHNIELWHGRYANSQQKWLHSVRENLLAWGFNTVGWVQEDGAKLTVSRWQPSRCAAGWRSPRGLRGRAISASRSASTARRWLAVGTPQDGPVAVASAGEPA